MILEFENYRIKTDSRQFVVQKKKVVQAGRLTKEENIGKEYWEDEAYCTTFNFALKLLRKKILLDNDDLKVIVNKLNQLESKIDEFTKILKEEI
ncbi:hypothetical protein [Clostridium sporogenes]|uniref:hypothetical protein n=1 Tax=Clostridium sporogenes TaxID=1509 RepID=UPI0013D52FF5|nr:hypothetical protein [Clostridium sporogenes]MCW6124741.1 hypothetical protein [Clostridium sporogenes]NFH40097.1 hypothetical protein [Clostridium sporogenes]NFQ67357.1 hypothetical protein [Clostridium sporogenes]NFQ85440.1 hypothetical protein [Clostridium sporogenes]